jgi:RNA polymerase sigma-54 factor
MYICKSAENLEFYLSDSNKENGLILMSFELRQQLKQAQKLILTPQLQQAIKLLQLSRLELLDTVTQEMESNPALEESSELTQDHEDQVESDSSTSQEDNSLEVTVGESPKEDFDWEAYLGDYSTNRRVRSERGGSRELPSFESRLTKKPSLESHLRWQLYLSRLNDDDIEVGNLIIGNLDKYGYLKATLSEIAEMAECDEMFVERVLMQIQEFDPPGVAARDLKECLLNQATILSLEDDLLVTIIKDHLHDLETKNYRAIVKATRRGREEIQAAIGIITNLNPKPGLAYEEDEIQYISPDVYVYKVDGDYVIVLNEDGLPKLRVSNYFKEMLSKDGEVSAKEREYIKDKMSSAAFLIKSIHQRQRTLYRVAESIVKLQRGFFDRGISYLRPLVLRDVAEDVGMHEATISRVTANKYMHTPRGIFELKYFFNSGVSSLSGGAVASESVKEHIRKIIQSENPKKPYSDLAIVEKLREVNIDIARRTVTKYRESLGILSSNLRRKPVWEPKKQKEPADLCVD